MKKLQNKIRKGFSLTEVLVGVMVLTMAVVSASNFLVSMMKSNAMNTNVLQAYYYSVEGLEAFRNMRDTYFMNYLNFCGQGDEDGDLFGSKNGFCKTGFYTVRFGDDSGVNGWELRKADVGDPDAGLIEKNGIDMVSLDDQTDTVPSKTFKRTCEVKEVEEEEAVKSKTKALERITLTVPADNIRSIRRIVTTDDPVDQLEITCTTKYEDGGNTGEVALSMILTNWKQ